MKLSSLTRTAHGHLYRDGNHDIRKYRRLALARRGRRYAGTCDLLAVSVFGERAGENNDCWHSILNNGVIRSRFLCKKSLMSIFYIESDSCIVYNRLTKSAVRTFLRVNVLGLLRFASPGGQACKVRKPNGFHPFRRTRRRSPELNLRGLRPPNPGIFRQADSI